MLSERMQKALNDQLNAELYSAYLYLSMSAYSGSVKLPGFANWMRMQAKEEQSHAMKFFDYINEQDGRILLRSIDSPPTDWASPLAIFEHVYRHEQKVTGLINNLVSLSIEERDEATHAMLQWFVKEQEEEEESADKVVQMIKHSGDTEQGLIEIDNKLAKRVFHASA